MKAVNKHDGFTVIEVLVIVLVILAISAVGYLVTKNIHEHSNNSKTTIALTTYNWKYEGLSIKIPSNWLTYNPQTPASNREYADLSSSTVVFYSPNIQTISGYDWGNSVQYAPKMNFSGSFAVWLDDQEPSGMSECNAPGQFSNDSIQKIIPFNVPGYEKMNIIEDGDNDPTTVSEMALTDQPVKLGVAGSPYLEETFKSKSHAGQYTCVEAGFFATVKPYGDFDYVVMPTAQFEGLKDYTTALDILKSVSY